MTARKRFWLEQHMAYPSVNPRACSSIRWEYIASFDTQDKAIDSVPHFHPHTRVVDSWTLPFGRPAVSPGPHVLAENAMGPACPACRILLPPPRRPPEAPCSMTSPHSPSTSQEGSPST